MFNPALIKLLRSLLERPKEYGYKEKKCKFKLTVPTSTQMFERTGVVDQLIRSYAPT